MVMNSSDVGMHQEPFVLKMILRMFYIVVFCIGLSGNLLVCIVVIQQRRMRTVMNCFTLNLAVSDLIIIVIYLPSQMAAYENNQNWPFGNAGCRITYSIIPVCLSASIATLLAISCERFRGIVFPFQPRLRLRTVRRIIISIWILSLTTALPLMIIAGTMRKGNNVFCEEMWPNQDSSRYYWVSMFLIQYVIPLLIMTVLYGVAGWKLQQRSRFLSGYAKSRSGSINFAAEVARQRQNQKITKMLVALILIYSFCMLPQHIVYFWTTYGNFKSWKYQLYVFRISNLFPVANSALNSIVYGTLQADFRKAYKLFFLRYNCCPSTGERRKKSVEEKLLKKFNNGAVKLKDKQIDSSEIPQKCTEKIEFSALNDTENKATSRNTKATLSSRLSSFSHRFLIWEESTTDTKQSKQSDFESHKNDKEKSTIHKNNLKDANQFKGSQNGMPLICVKTTHQPLNNETRKEENEAHDKEPDKKLSNFDDDLKMNDLCELELAKETIL